MEEFFPKVSIIIPVYNGENFLSQAIDSALAQTYNNYEIIVVNDGSTDRTEEIAMSYGNKIHYFKKDNGGQSSALNFGIEKMQGEYFSWLSHDDKYYPEKLERSVQVLAELQDKRTIIYTASTSVDESGRKIKSVFIEEDGKINPTYFLLRYNSFNGNSLLIHADLLKNTGNFNLSRPHTSDVELFFNLSRLYSFHYINEELVYSRTHKHQATFRNYKYHIYESNLFLIDSLNKLTNKDLAKISDFEMPEKVLTELSLNWSNRGYKYAYKMALFRLYNSTNTSFYRIFKLRIYCSYLYSKKYLRTYLRFVK